MTKEEWIEELQANIGAHAEDMHLLLDKVLGAVQNDKLVPA